MLTYHGIPFKRWDYTPIIGETWMKAKAGKLFSRERVTAPVLLIPEGNAISIRLMGPPSLLLLMRSVLA